VDNEQLQKDIAEIKKSVKKIERYFFWNSFWNWIKIIIWIIIIISGIIYIPRFLTNFQKQLQNLIPLKTNSEFFRDIIK